MPNRGARSHDICNGAIQRPRRLFVVRAPSLALILLASLGAVEGVVDGEQPKTLIFQSWLIFERGYMGIHPDPDGPCNNTCRPGDYEHWYDWTYQSPLCDNRTTDCNGCVECSPSTLPEVGKEPDNVIGAIGNLVGQTQTVLHAGVERVGVRMDTCRHYQRRRRCRPIQSQGSAKRPQLRFVTKEAVSVGVGGCASQFALRPDMFVGSTYTTNPANLSGFEPTLEDGFIYARVESPILFLKGTYFQICYHDGNGEDWVEFRKNQMMDMLVKVLGASHNCTGLNCFAQQRAECHSLNVTSSGDAVCSLIINEIIGEEQGSASVTPPFHATYDENGTQITYTAPLCTDGLLESQLDGGIVDPLAVTQNAQYSREVQPLYDLDLSRLRHEAAAAVAAPRGTATYAVCYCPTASGTGRTQCQSPDRYGQQIGTLMFFEASACDPHDPVHCEPRYSVVASGQTFILRVFCPPSGCLPDEESRVKLVRPSATTRMASWEPNNGCKVKVHVDGWVPSAGCQSKDSCVASGGRRQDYRSWGDNTTGYWAWVPGIRPGVERRDLRGGPNEDRSKGVDVCFCAGRCDGEGGNWFKAGELRIAPVRLASVASGSLRSIAIVGVKGTIGFVGRQEERSFGMNEGGVVKLVADPYLNLTGSQCTAAPYESQNIEGLNTPADTLQRQSTWGAGMIFNGGDSSRGMVPHNIGVVAVCFCGNMDEEGKCLTGDYFVVGRLTLQGPRVGQSWTISKLGLFSFEFHGHGFELGDTLRLSASPCAGGSPTGITSQIAVGCPSDCSLHDIGTDLNVTMLTSSTFACDDILEGCQYVPVVRIHPEGNGTDIEFSQDPLLETFDEITIDSGISGGTIGQRETMQGMYAMLDGPGQQYVSQSILAHATWPSKIGRTQERRLRRLSYGSIGEEMPNFTIADTGATWTRRNRAHSRHELLLTVPAEAAAQQLYVCWRGEKAQALNAEGDGYSAEVGTLRFERPPSMQGLSFAVVAPVSNESVTAVLSFETGASAYTPAERGTTLVVQFPNLAVLEPRTSSGLAPPSEGRSSATQARCADIVLESWSNRETDGFPVPKHCRFRPKYQVPGVAEVLELELEFEPYNGLAHLTRYQLVFNVFVHDPSYTGNVVLVEASDDLYSAPNTAVELGQATLEAGIDLGTDILSEIRLEDTTSSAAAVQLSGADATVRLRISPTGRVTAPGNLHLVLRPLTQWQLASATVANVPSETRCNARADGVRGITNAWGGENKCIVGLASVDLSVSPDCSVAVTLKQTASVSGFFSARPSAVILGTGGSRQYLHELGGVYFHAPKAPIAMVVISRGDGDAAPYYEAQNALYMRILFPAGLRREANFTITSPAFMADCGNATTLPDSRLLNVSAPPPYGSGAIRQGTWAVESNESLTERACHWHHIDADLLPGSSVFLQFNYRNPSRPFKSYDDANIWTGILRDTLLSQPLDFSFGPPSSLASVTADGDAGPLSYSASAAVVGVLPFAHITPTNMILGQQQIVYIYLEVMQMVPSGFIEVEAPWNFDFGSEPCHVHQVSTDLYYGTVAGGIEAKLVRAPRIQSCITSRWPAATSRFGSKRYSVARVGIGRNLTLETRYAFGLDVLNPEFTDFTPSDQFLWAIRTLDENGSPIDRSRGCITMVGEADGHLHDTWQLYRAPLIRVPRLIWGELMPFPSSNAQTFVTIVPIRVPFDLNVPMRLTCPLGYQWTDPTPYWKPLPAGASAPFPMMPAVRGKQFLWWENPVPLFYGEAYGFRVPLIVPNWPFAMNTFYMEFGYRQEGIWEDQNPGRWPSAIVVGGPSIRVVRGPQVDYQSGQAGLTHQVIVKLETKTPLFPGEGFVFEAGPATEYILCTCPPREVLKTLSCLIEWPDDTDQMRIRISATSAIIRAGLMHFPLDCRNPSPYILHETWTVGSYMSPDDYPQTVPVDGFAIVPGFSIKPPLGYFRLVLGQTDGPQFPRRLIWQEPRPLQNSSALIKFRVRDRSMFPGDFDWVEPSRARLRAPEGALWPVDCLDSIDNRRTSKWPSDCIEMPMPRTCLGVLSRAYMNWTTMLQRDIAPNYFCALVTVLNPPQQPTSNNWTLEVDNQSSDLSAGVFIQAFRELTIETATQGARAFTGVVGDNRSNRVRFSFYPSTLGEELRVVGPESFDFGESDVCGTMRLLETTVTNGVVKVEVPWLNSCKFSGSTFTLGFNTPMRPESRYDLALDVLNPSTTEVVGSGLFMFYSDEVGGFVGDEGRVEQPVIRPTVYDIVVRRSQGGVGPQEKISVIKTFAFNQAIRESDRLEIRMPPDFLFAWEGRLDCPFRWLVPREGPAPFCECPERLCRATMELDELNSSTYLSAVWPARSVISVELELINPRRIVDPLKNVFEVRLLNPIFSDDRDIPREIGAYRCWQIFAPLSGVMVSFANDDVRRASGHNATLLLTFNPGNDAEVLQLTAFTPAGWDFTQSHYRLREFRGPSDTRPEKPHVFIVDGMPGIERGRQLDIEIAGVTNAPIGGPARFQLETFSKDLTRNWKRVDVSDEFEAFIAPGLLDDTARRLRTQRALVDDRSDFLFAQLPPRLHTNEAIYEWNFTTSQKTVIGDYFAITTPNIATQLSARFVSMKAHNSVGGFDEDVRIIVEMVDDVLRVLPNETLDDNTRYNIRVSGRVVVDLLPKCAQKYLLVNLIRPGYELPLATNDGYVAPGTWELEVCTSADFLTPFKVESSGSAPLAKTLVLGQIPLGYRNDLTVLAPAGMAIQCGGTGDNCAEAIENFAGTGRLGIKGLKVDQRGVFELPINMPPIYVEGQNYWAALVTRSDFTGALAGYVGGWAIYEGFPLRQMPGYVNYAAAPLAKGIQLTMSLKPSRESSRVATGDGRASYLILKAPFGYELLCQEPLYEAVFLPAPTRAVCIRDENETNKVTLRFEDAELLDLEEFVLGLGLNIPLSTPAENYFEAVLKNIDNETIDANVMIPGVLVPGERLRGGVVWQVREHANREWLELWVNDAQERGVFQQCFAFALNVSLHSVSIENVLLSVTPATLAPTAAPTPSVRRLVQADESKMSLAVNFSVAVAETGSNAVAALETWLKSFQLDYRLLSKSLHTASARASLALPTLADANVTIGPTYPPPNISRPFLFWTESDPGAISTVTLEFTLNKANDFIRAVLIEMPVGFRHRIQYAEDVISNLPTERIEGAAIATWRPTALRVMLAAREMLEVGEYHITFDVDVPTAMPAMNVWGMTVCGSTICDSPRHPGMLLNFALPGFRVGERMPEVRVAGAHGLSAVSRVLALPVLATVVWALT